MYSMLVFQLSWWGSPATIFGYLYFLPKGLGFSDYSPVKEIAPDSVISSTGLITTRQVRLSTYACVIQAINSGAMGATISCFKNLHTWVQVRLACWAIWASLVRRVLHIIAHFAGGWYGQSFMTHHLHVDSTSQAISELKSLNIST